MIARFKLIKSSLLRNRILIENFTFLSILQVSNLLLFLITIPYLFRVLGSESYGLVIFAQTIVYYLTILTNYGFNLPITRDISVNRDNNEKLSEILSAVLSLKFVLFLLSLAIMATMTYFIPVFRENRLLFMFSMLACLSEALFPIWFFQGIEKMKYIMFINISTRILATVFVFVLIRESSDYIRYPLIWGSGTIAGAVSGLVIVFKKYSIPFRIQSIGTLFSYFRENTLYFFSNVSTQVYINANKIVAGAFLGMTQVAWYDIADKIVNIAKVPLSLLGQALFPKVAKERNINYLKTIMYITVLFTLIVVTTIFIFSFTLIELFSGNSNPAAINVLRILSISLIPISIGIFYGDLLLINFGLKAEYAKMRFMGLVLYLMFIMILYFSSGLVVTTIAICVLFVESFIMLYSLIIVRKNKLLFKSDF